MKAKEVLRRYAAGERDFQRVNLRGQSFKGQDLSGADFSEADIRSTNFKNANLQGVDFTGAKAGLQKRCAIALLFISLLLFIFSKIYSLVIGYSGLLLFDEITPQNFYIGLFTLAFSVISLITVYREGFVAGAFAITFNIVLAIAAVFFAGGILGTESDAYTYILGVFSGTLLGGFGVIFIAVFSFAFTVAGAVNFAGSLVTALIVSLVTALWTFILFGFFAGSAIFTFSLFELCIAWRILKGDDREVWIRSFAVAFAATGGTNFQGANLTHAIFTSATLKNTDFRKAIITRTCFRNAKKLDLARPGTTYLKNLKLQQWLIGTGQDNNFEGIDLRGVNFQGKNLTDASFIGVDLREANLQDADLSRAKLVQTKLDKTDFTGATLTGAFIEDWNITVNTKLRGMRCDYIYLRLPTRDDSDPHRKPDNRNEIFADGDFEDFIKPIFDTLDLYHNQNVDPRAIALAWKKLAENNPDANLRFAAMEVKGEDNLLLKLKTSSGADKSQLNVEYFEEYNHIKALNEVNKKLLAEKNERIQKLENMIELALKTPKYYSEGDLIKGNKKDESRKIEVEGNVNASGAGAFSLGDINATVANTINQLPSSSNPNEPGIKELLTQLQQAVDDLNLSEDNQKQALEQIQTLAEVGQNTQDETMQKKAKKAVGFLKVIADGIEPTTQLAQACGKVLPKILLLFGL